MTGIGSGVFEIALRFHGNAFRLMYAVQIDYDLWVYPRLPKEIENRDQTLQQEVDLIKERLKRLKEVLQ